MKNRENIYPHNRLFYILLIHTYCLNLHVMKFA